MAREGVACPVCGGAAIVTRTDTVPAMPADHYRGWPLEALRWQTLRCRACGHEGERVVPVGRVRWQDKTHHCRNGA